MATPIIVCTVDNKCLPVLEASVKAYAPQANLISHKVDRSTFGQSYNAAMAKAFEQYDEIIIANDDVVLTPLTYQTLMQDVEELKRQHGDSLGFVAANADNVRDSQSVKVNDFSQYIRTYAISPLFAWISKKAFQAAQFPHTNWFSDDIICEDLSRSGFVHYVSRAYVHHAGSQTIGKDDFHHYQEAIRWIEAHRPEYVSMFKREGANMAFISGIGLPALLDFKPNLIGIEIGLNRGETTKHLFDNLPNLVLHGIDPYLEYQDWDGNVLTPNERIWTYDIFIKHVSNYRDRMIHHRMLSDDAAQHLPDDAFDFIFIDGLHTYDQVLKDCQNYYAKIKSGGLFAGHDYRVIEGVNRAVNEFAASVGATVLETHNDVWYWVKP